MSKSERGKKKNGWGGVDGGGDEIKLRHGWLERYWRDINCVEVLITLVGFDYIYIISYTRCNIMIHHI